jgi:toxin CptA
MADRLRIALGPSVSLAVWLGGAHVVGLAGFWLAPLTWPVSAGASAMIALSLVVSLRRHAFRSSPGAIIELEVDEQCLAAAQLRDGRWLECEVDASSFVSPMLTIVNLRPRLRGGMRAVLVAPDCVQLEAFRRLRVWLRWRCSGRRQLPLDDQT